MCRQSNAQQILAIAINTNTTSEAVQFAEAAIAGCLDGIIELVSFEAAYNVAQRLADAIISANHPAMPAPPPAQGAPTHEPT